MSLNIKKNIKKNKNLINNFLIKIIKKNSCIIKKVYLSLQYQKRYKN